MKRIRSIIVDDEPSARRTLKSLIDRFCSEIDVVAEADSIDAAKIVIESKDPDVVFLDVQMPGGTGVDLLNQLPERNFEVIFTTAYEDYALEAIQQAALDYLVKPIDIEELKRAIDRAYERINEKRMVSEVENAKGGKLILPTSEGNYVVDLDDIIYCEADRNYTKVLLEDRKELLLSKTLKYFEERLPTTLFFRSHKSFLINLNQIHKINKGQLGTIEMKNGKEVLVGREKRDLLMKLVRE